MLLITALLLWAAWGLVGELRAAAFLHARAPHRPVENNSGWRRTLHPIVRLAGFLERGTVGLPAGSRVAFASPNDEPEAAFFRYLWASYLEPELVWIPLHEAEAARAPYRVVFGASIEGEGLEILHSEAAGTVARLRAPGEVRSP